MISYVVRIVGRGLLHARKARTAITDPLQQRYRAWPWYCDQNLHVNNAHYLTFMDYGRVVWFVRSGVLARARRDGLRPMVAALAITYRREIRWFASFELTTRAVGVDGRWIYIVQEFWRGEKVAARALVRMGVSGPDGLVDVAEWLGTEPPDLPDDVRAWATAADMSAAVIR